MRPTGAPPNQISDPSPEKPIFRTGLNPGMWLSQLRFTKRPEPTRVSHKSSGPSQLETNAANFPSGESVASASSPAKLVNRVKVALDNGLSGAGLARLRLQPAKADVSARRLIATHRLHRECRDVPRGSPATLAGALPLSSASSSSARASATSADGAWGLSRGHAAEGGDQGWRVAGSAAHSGSRSRIATNVPIPFHPETPDRRSAFRITHTQMPRCPCACRRPVLEPAPDSCTPPSRGWSLSACCLWSRPAIATRRSPPLARPRSSTFTMPSG